MKNRSLTLILLVTIVTLSICQSEAASKKHAANESLQHCEFPLSLPGPRFNSPSQYLELYRRDLNNEKAFYPAALCLAHSGKVAAAEKLSKDASKAHPKWASPYFILAKTAEFALEDEQALALFQRAVKLNPEWVQADYDYAMALKAHENFKEAITVSDAALKICDAHQEAKATHKYKHLLRRCKAQSLYNLHDYTAAAQEIKKEPVDERSQQVQKLLAQCYRESKQWTEFLSWTDSYVKSHPQDEDFRFLRAQAYAGTGQWQKAIDDLTMNLRLYDARKPKKLGLSELYEKREVRLLRAQMYEKLGKRDQAKKERAILKEQMGQSYKETMFRAKQ